MALHPLPQDLVAETHDGIGIVPSHRLESAMYGEDDRQVPDFDQMVRDTRVWCEAHAVTFYGAPGEDFDLAKGLEGAKAADHRFLVVENLS